MQRVETNASRDLFGPRPRLRRLVFRIAFGLAGTLPLWCTRTLAYFIGSIGWWLDTRGRPIVRRNLAHFIPAQCPEALSRAVRRSYVAFNWSMAESFALSRFSAASFAVPTVTLVDPWGVFAHGPLRGPAVCATIHCNWELFAAVCHHLGLITGVHAIALSHGDAAIDALFERARNSAGCRSVLLDRAPLASLRALRDGHILGIIGERDYTGNGVPVRFAGEVTSIPIGPAALAVQAQAPVVPLFLARRSATRFVLIAGKPLRSDPGAPKSAQVAALTAQLARLYARFIAAAPAQWVAFHDAWAVAPRHHHKHPHVSEIAAAAQAT